MGFWSHALALIVGLLMGVAIGLDMDNYDDFPEDDWDDDDEDEIACGDTTIKHANLDEDI